MDRLFSLTQLVVSCIMFLCLGTGITAHIIMGHINSISGYLVAALFLVLMWSLVRNSWNEYIEEKNK